MEAQQNVPDTGQRDLSYPQPPGRSQWTFNVDLVWVRRATITVLLLVAALWVAKWAFDRLSGFLFLLLCAWLFGVAMDPVVTWLAKRGMSRRLATMLVLLSFLLATVLFFVAFGSLLINQVIQLVTAEPASIGDATVWVNRTFHTSIDPTSITKQLNISPEQAASIAQNLAGGVLGILSSIIGVIFEVFTLLLFAYYFCAEGPKLRDTVAEWLPRQHQRVFNDVWRIAVQKTGGFVISRLVLAVLSASFHSIFFFVIDIPYWLPLGIFAGVVSQFIPTVGTYIGIALPCLVAVFNEPLDAIWIIAFATVYQQIENYFFSPKISARTMDVHPAVAFGSVIVGATLFGPVGALIGIPLAAMILAVAATYGKRYELVDPQDPPELPGLPSPNQPEDAEPVATS